MIIEAKNICKNYGTLQVLKNLNIAIPQAKVSAIVGASGSGKSTLLHILGTLDSPDKGELFFEGKALSHKNTKALAAFRNEKLGFVFQFHHLLPEFTAEENILIPAMIGKRNIDTSKKRAKYLMELLKIENRSHHKPHQLSGGEQQRVAVARALINEPLLVLADEPSGNLDTQHALELHDMFFSLSKEINQTFVIITHNENLASKADCKFEMKDGQIVNTIFK